MKTKKQRIKEIKKQIKNNKELYIAFSYKYPDDDEFLVSLQENNVKLKQKLKGIKLGIW